MKWIKQFTEEIKHIGPDLRIQNGGRFNLDNQPLTGQLKPPPPTPHWVAGRKTGRVG